ncbi:MAG: transcriptional repressor NrdR [Spirochaetales bacterium]|nr:transcriptional repressor NrdR [Spirochaetales bacterium]
MRCPRCGMVEDKVVESRQNATGSGIRRRRECLSCGYRFTSYERIVEKPLMIIKRDGRREPFDTAKLERGIQRSIEKRPIPADVVEDLLHRIEDEALLAGKAAREISSAELGNIVLNKLSSLDRVAYIRFASVYRNFEDLGQFIKEIEVIS